MLNNINRGIVCFFSFGLFKFWLLSWNYVHDNWTTKAFFSKTPSSFMLFVIVKTKCNINTSYYWITFPFLCLNSQSEAKARFRSKGSFHWHQPEAKDKANLHRKKEWVSEAAWREGVGTWSVQGCPLVGWASNTLLLRDDKTNVC